MVSLKGLTYVLKSLSASMDCDAKVCEVFVSKVFEVSESKV